MPDIDIRGSAIAVAGALVGLIVELMSISLIAADLLNVQTRVVYQVLNIVAIFILVHITRYWGYSHLFGWWVGLLFLQFGGTGYGFNGLEFSGYFVAPIFILFTKLVR